MDSLGSLNIYFWIAIVLLTLNAMLYTHSVLKTKDKGYKYELFGAIVGYLVFASLMYEMTTY